MVYYLTRFASWLAARVPQRARHALGGPLTVLVYYGWSAKRRVTIANMAQVLGTTPDDPRAKQLARISWRNYGRYLSDFFYLPNTTPSAVLARTRDVSATAGGAFAQIDEARAAGKGIILVSAHFGAWDVAGVVVSTHAPIHLLVETFADPRMDRLVQEQRRGLGMEVLRIERTPRQILRVLQGNGIVAVAVDRPVPPEEGVPVTFFGRTCYVPGGIAQLALKSGAAILPGACWYDEQYSSTYYVAAGPVIYPRPTGNRRDDTIALMQEMFDALETHMRPRPEQWAMFRAFWPEQPTAAADRAQTPDHVLSATPVEAAVSRAASTGEAHGDALPA